jgi:hypothetical protein
MTAQAGTPMAPYLIEIPGRKKRRTSERLGRKNSRTLAQWDVIDAMPGMARYGTEDPTALEGGKMER